MARAAAATAGGKGSRAKDKPKNGKSHDNDNDHSSNPASDTKEPIPTDDPDAPDDPQTQNPDHNPPTTIDPYAELALPRSATAAEIRTAYRRLALQRHPDKAATPADRPAAHAAFQRLAFAYAVLGDERRRRRYDATGSTAESIGPGLGDEDGEDGKDAFDWADFFRAQFAEVVTVERVEQFKREYRGQGESSGEGKDTAGEEEKGDSQEKRDVLAAYTRFEGDLDRVFEVVMLSDVLADEQRFRVMIDAAVAAGTVPAFDAYTHEPPAKKKRRVDRARREAALAAKEQAKREKARRGGGDQADTSKSKSKSKKEGGGGGGEAELMALIGRRQKERASTFLDDLETKYAGGGDARGKRGVKRRAVDEPPEEAFATNRKVNQAARAPAAVDEDDEGKDREEEQDDGPRPKRKKVAGGRRSRKTGA